MLQQTQTHRVVDKYLEFLNVFPTVEYLAQSSLADVLRIWSGLGYNRRARYLRDLAQSVVLNYHGQIPSSPEVLVTLPGIGPYTAGAVCVFAFKSPLPLIETNIRAVFIEWFFKGMRRKIADSEILPLISETMYRRDVSRWYYALMDYGVQLKRAKPGIGKRSKRHQRQKPFEGSIRQLRGAILRVLLRENPIPLKSLIAALPQFSPARTRRALTGLIADNMITEAKGGRLRLTS